MNDSFFVPSYKVLNNKNSIVTYSNITHWLIAKVKITSKKIYCWVNDELMTVSDFNINLNKTDIKNIINDSINAYMGI